MAVEYSILPLTFNHVAFPPKLPGRHDSEEETENVQKDLTARMLGAISVLKQNTQGETLHVWQSIETSLRTCMLVNEKGFINKANFLSALEHLQVDASIILYVGSQNACLFIRKPSTKGDVGFEVFEASPTAEQTLASQGALQWDFPSVAVSLPACEFESTVFQESLATFIEKASIETIDEFVPKTQKAGARVSEYRDTVDPAMITHFLMTVLETNGNRVDTPLLRKRIKDNVCWDDAELPWRRSPFWLVLRVCTQRLLYLRLGAEHGRIQYKLLMTLLLAKLLENSVYELHAEESNFLKTKLCRRLAKVELELQKATSHDACVGLAAIVTQLCQNSIDIATSHFEAEWKSFTNEFQRQVPLLPLWAQEEDLRLRLPNSSAYIRDVLNRKRNRNYVSSQRADTGAPGPNAKTSTTEQFAALTTRYSALAENEISIEFDARRIPASLKLCEAQCSAVANEIERYLSAVGDAYENDPEQMSVFVLSLFEMWVHMDKCALVAYPFLQNLHPWFEPELLDVLLLGRLHDLERLQAVQQYLLQRGEQAQDKGMTVLMDPSPGCSADRYFDSESASKIREMQGKIEAASLKAREAKKDDLARVNSKFQQLTERMAATSCTQRRRPDGTHDDRGCEYCYCVRSRYRLKIKAHEDYLPSDKNLVQKRAIVFELGMPSPFAAYRDTTWNIIATLCAHSESLTSPQPEKLLQEYAPLQPFNRRGNEDGITLASRTKSYLGTHYRWRKLPAPVQRVLFPFGMKMSYYDKKRQMWLSEFPRKLTIAHHFALQLPPHLPFSTLYSSAAFAPEASGPSSYETAASITHCSSSLTVHEFVTSQNLVSGRHRRWLSILTELGSANVNFSLLDTTYLFRLLAQQAGPRLGSDVRRAVHAVFNDVVFCNQLIRQITQHVEIISANWRETNYMETMLTLTVQLCVLCCPEASARARELLLKIRNVTQAWISALRNEMRNAQEVDTAENAARYCFISALLCRRTFVVEPSHDNTLDPKSLQCFVEATLAMQEALVVDMSKFSTATRNILIRDIKASVKIRTLIETSVLRHPTTLSLAIDAVWPNADGVARTYSKWEFLASPYDWWVMSTIESTEYTITQVMHYHLIEGHLLINGQPIGKLPADIRDSEILKELFGNQRLVAFPSNMPGMSYVLASTKEDNYIHLGYRNDELVVRAQTSRTTMELVPRSVFHNESDFDLPSPLVQSCVHWLDLWSGKLQIRRHPRIWKGFTWEIDTINQWARRGQSILIDPHSKVFKSITQIFRHFEEPWMLTVIQPPNGYLTVELKRMDLTFYVNKRGLLQCWQLAAEIDPSQDAGTFYGLDSMIILRNIFNRTQRSIITPLGNPQYKRQRMHVRVRIDNNGSHARYGIDNVLGRLSSPAEPRLLYHKALLHALTSYFIPDPLTGRTGTEEALSSLQSGMYQPWVPLAKDSVEVLRTIANLTPRRTYYPEHKKCQETVKWSASLTTTIQHDAFQVVVSAIVEKSKRLSLFQLGPSNVGTMETPTASHLGQRAVWRRFIYERPGIMSPEPSKPPDAPYTTRYSGTLSQRSLNVREIVGLLRTKPHLIHTTKSLTNLLNQQSVIGGYKRSFSEGALEDSLVANISHEWGSLIRLCMHSKSENAYQLMFQLGMLAFGKDVNMALLRTIVAFFVLKELRDLDLPQYSSINGFSIDEHPACETFIALMKATCEFYRDPAGTKTKKKREAARVVWEYHSQDRAKEYDELAKFLIDQWPCSQPSVEAFESTYINTDFAVNSVMPEWQRLYQNLQFSNHIKEIQQILDRHYTPSNMIEEFNQAIENEILGGVSKRALFIPRLGQDLIKQIGPKIDANGTLNSVEQWAIVKAGPSSQIGHPKRPYLRAPETLELESITKRFVNSNCPVQSSYGNDLNESITALKMIDASTIEKLTLDVDYVEGVKRLNGIIKEATAIVNQMYARIADSLVSGHPAFKWLHQGNLWPSMTPISILAQLRSESKFVFGCNMKEAFIAYGLAIVNVQRLIRIKEAFGKRDQAKLQDEYRNLGHVNWDPCSRPDWLLLEIDGNMQIREEQITVAEEMISPSSRSNSVLQMNMGKGKTSVIIPMIGSVLADGETLARILVPKALLSQTAQILQARLGGLLGREITHIPFSRRTPTTTQVISEYRALHEETVLKSGIILGVPEHVLSFKLSGLQRMSDSKINEAIDMVGIQRWMDRTCRDVLDECDFTLAVKTQLIYPSGSQLAVDGHPDRWKVIMAVLDLVVHHLHDLARDFPKSIDIIQPTYTEFPVAYFLRADVENALIEKLSSTISYSQTSIFSTRNFIHEHEEAIKLFISQEKLDKSISDDFLTWISDKPKVGKIVHLLRGLFVHGILLLCLKKRWNVQYGLHPNRDPMAVPFYAKGVPSEQAEWGHPDVAILLTILAFYNQGLDIKQLRQSLQAVLRSDDPATEYDRWTQTSSALPEPLRHWNIINVDDDRQVAEIWRHLRLKMVVVNYFLSKFVFPVHAKQFSIKMQASGWDIPLIGDLTTVSSFNQSTKQGLTTGFSGTNDNRRLMPLTIQQRDLPGLRHTNAEVLTYLLQERNRKYIQATHTNSKRYSELDLLCRLKNEEIRILIDAGAFILEMNNEALVKAWLDQDKRAQAAVYFGKDNKAWVQYQTGKTVPLIATPFVDNMKNCLVYLDEAHTRGTDLKLPPFAKGALTLGLNQTKDHTVQAAMRLRQLGTTQSITFIAPPEVHQSIMDVRQKARNVSIDSSDVIHWLLVQTCATNKDLQPLYFAQGSDFCHRMQGAEKYKNFLTSSGLQKGYLQVLQRREHQSLEDLYAPSALKALGERPAAESATETTFSGQLNIFMRELRRSYQLTNPNNWSLRSSAFEEVEQEREVAYEIEEERELQRPGLAKALSFPGLHKSLSEFVKTGALGADTECIKASVVLESSQLGIKHAIKISSIMPHLYVSPEFVKTVRKKKRKDDRFIRPVNWLLWSTKSEEALVVIPEEAEALIPILRKNPRSVVHMILYAAPVTKRMLHFNSMDYYSLPNLPALWTPPAWLAFEVGLLAGRLYFAFYEYSSLLVRLRKCPNDTPSHSFLETSNRGFNQNEALVDFLQEWLSLRRQGQDISHTPMGYLCQGLPLRVNHPFFSNVKTEEQGNSTEDQIFRLTKKPAVTEDDGYYDSGDDQTIFVETADLEESEDENEVVEASG